MAWDSEENARARAKLAGQPLASMPPAVSSEAPIMSPVDAPPEQGVDLASVRGMSPVAIPDHEPKLGDPDEFLYVPRDHYTNEKYKQLHPIDAIGRQVANTFIERDRLMREREKGFDKLAAVNETKELNPYYEAPVDFAGPSPDLNPNRDSKKDTAETAGKDTPATNKGRGQAASQSGGGRTSGDSGGLDADGMPLNARSNEEAVAWAQGGAAGGSFAAPKGADGLPWDPRLGVSKETLKKHVEAPGRMKNLVAAEGLDQYLANQNAIDVMEEETRKADERRAQYAAAEANRQARTRQQMLSIELATDEAKKAELGGSSYLERNPVAGILGAIGAVIGGAYAGRTGRENEGMKALDNAIQRDLDIQKYNLNKKQQNVENQKSLLGQMRQTFGDEQLADRAAEVAMRDIVSQKMSTMAAQASNQKLKNDIAIQKEVFDNQTNNLRMGLEQQVYAAQHPVQRGGPALPKKTDNALFVPGLGGNAPNEKTADAARKALTAIDQYEKEAADLMALRNDPKNFLNPATRRLMRTKSARMVTLQKDINDWGAVTGSDISMSPIAPEEGADISSIGLNDAIAESVGQTKRLRASMKRNFGIAEANQDVVERPDGSREIRTQLTGNIEKPKPFVGTK